MTWRRSWYPRRNLFRGSAQVMGWSVIRHLLLRKIAPLIAALACAAPGKLPPPRPELAPEVVEQLRCAAENRSTAPSYVWVDVRDGERGLRWSTVVESGVVYPDLQANPSTRFELGARPALVPPYDAKLLASARSHLDRFSDADISDGLTPESQYGKIRSFTREDSIFWVEPSEVERRKKALAHALFERGFYPSRGDFVPVLYASRRACREPGAHDPIWREAHDELPARP